MTIPPPPKISGIPPPPPPVKSAPPKLKKAEAKSRDAMLSDINNFKAKKLKKTVTNDRSAPVVGKPKPSNSSGGRNTVGSSGESSSMSGGLGGLFAGGMPKLRPAGAKGPAKLPPGKNKGNNLPLSSNRFKSPATNMDIKSQPASVNKSYHVQPNKNSQFSAPKKSNQPALPVNQKPSLNKLKPAQKFGVNKPAPPSQRPNLPGKPISFNKAPVSPVNKHFSGNRPQQIIGRPQPPPGRNGPPPPPPSRGSAKEKFGTMPSRSMVPLPSKKPDASSKSYNTVRGPPPPNRPNIAPNPPPTSSIPQNRSNLHPGPPPPMRSGSVGNNDYNRSTSHSHGRQVPPPPPSRDNRHSNSVAPPPPPPRVSNMQDSRSTIRNSGGQIGSSGSFVRSSSGKSVGHHNISHDSEFDERFNFETAFPAPESYNNVKKTYPSLMQKKTGGNRRIPPHLHA